MKGIVKRVLAANTAIQYMEIQGGAPYKIVRCLSKLRSALADEARIAEERQESLLNEYNGKPANGMVIAFPDADARQKFEKEWEDVLNTEVEINIERVDLSSLADNIVFHNTNVDVEALSTFIYFGDE